MINDQLKRHPFVYSCSAAGALAGAWFFEGLIAIALGAVLGYAVGFIVESNRRRLHLE